MYVKNTINHSRASSVKHPDLVITLPADVLVPNCVRLSAEAMLTERYDIFLSKLFCLSMTSFNYFDYFQLQFRQPEEPFFY